MTGFKSEAIWVTKRILLTPITYNKDIFFQPFINEPQKLFQNQKHKAQ